MKKWPALFTFLFVCSASQVLSQCPQLVDTLFYAGFEEGLPTEWTLDSESAPRGWKIDGAKFGSYANPGSGKWLYIDDSQAENHTGGSILTHVFELGEGLKSTRLTFLLNFQSFDGNGRFGVEMKSKDDWILIFETTEDIQARIDIDITELANAQSQFRFVYEDGDTWGWGAGIDEFALLRSRSICGNGSCESLETPETCPDDCAKSAPSTWIESGKDLQGKSVDYFAFSGNAICDDCSQKIPLGFDFTFYDSSYREVFINANGNLSFEETWISYVPEPFCLESPKLIAPFFSDVDLSKGGEILYYADPDKHYLIVLWKDVPYYGCEKDCGTKNTYQVLLTDGSIDRLGEVILPSGTNVVFSYQNMEWSGGTASGSIDGFGGSPATVGINEGSLPQCKDYGVFDKSGYRFASESGENCPANGVDHLDSTSLFFNAEIGSIADYQGISSFTGNFTPKGVLLNWKIDTFKEPGYFEIERSLDDQHYEFISLMEISPEAYESKHLSYKFLDEEALGLEPYYRIRYLGGGTNIDSASIRTLRLGGTSPVTENPSFELLSIGPNPFRQYLGIKLSGKPGRVLSYQMLDMAGRRILGGKIMMEGPSQNLRLETDGLPVGMYTVFLESDGFKDYVRVQKNKK